MISRRTLASSGTGALMSVIFVSVPLFTSRRTKFAGVVRLSWRITIPEDGKLQFGGLLPTVLQWGEVHPTDSMDANGFQLGALSNPVNLKALDFRDGITGGATM